MGLVKGNLAARRYRVSGIVEPGYRGRFQDALQQHRFVPPASKVQKAPVVGWALTRNPLDADFANMNDWLVEPVLHLVLRIDEKKLPSSFKHHLQKRVRAWCAENARERCPPKVKAELKEILETEMLQHVEPRTTTIPVGWHVDGGWLVVASCSDAANDRVRKHFRTTFGQLGFAIEPATLVDGLTPDELAGLDRAGAIDLETT